MAVDTVLHFKIQLDKVLGEIGYEMDRLVALYPMTSLLATASSWQSIGEIQVRPELRSKDARRLVL